MDRDDERIASPEAELRVPWSGSGRPVPRLVLQPLQAFLRTEEAGGVLLLAASIIALVWANSPWRASYNALWQTQLTIGVGAWSLAEDLQQHAADLGDPGRRIRPVPQGQGGEEKVEHVVGEGQALGAGME
jgi:Na+/H+ antiporter 1